MVRYHYALVDDLITREEFDRRIEAKTAECGNLVDEVAAALLVVKDLNRAHVKVRQLRGKSSLFCFYAKIIAFSGVKEFERDGDEKGLIARLTVADETGQVDLVFWDEQAAALSETFEIGEVVEIIGRHGKNGRDIMPLNLRITPCKIDCDMTPKERKAPQRKNLTMFIISLQDVRSYTRRDGTTGEMISGTAGDNSGTFRFVCFDATRLSGVHAGMAIEASEAIEKESDFGGREIVIDDETVINRSKSCPEIPITPLSEVVPERIASVHGKVTNVTPMKEFTRRDGTLSHVKNVRISDETAEIPLVLWDDEAGKPLLVGEEVHVYHALPRNGRFQKIEISVGKGGCIKVIPEGSGRYITIEGMILHLSDGIRIDNGAAAYLVETSLEHGTIAKMSGHVYGKRLFFESEESVNMGSDSIKARLNNLIDES